MKIPQAVLQSLVWSGLQAASDGTPAIITRKGSRIDLTENGAEFTATVHKYTGEVLARSWPLDGSRDSAMLARGVRMFFGKVRA
ncbi:hypothetical protein [Actinomadura alba]|uniref:Uncharacterized protein n=1 Tax=Actinomadura alba TaxID=406431 RepID=A0ABR7LTR8_9ACTN|nr:hypothetical protein [Actinomadura alba]MBC6468245.1 hypothetical protein [Actinomadura alba]